MKRKVALGIGIGAVLLAIVVTVLWVCWPKTFALSSEYYGKSALNEIDEAQLKSLIDEKKSFALLLWQPSCQTSVDFEKIVEGFSQQNQITIEKMKFSDAKKSGLVGDLRFYPSMALYHDGGLVTFLRADEEEDLAAYQTAEGFAKWWDKYVKRKE